MAFTDNKIQSVWEKATKVDNYDENLYRKDLAGAWIKRDQYGQENSFGWEIDHVYPESKGGTDDLLNLRPMQWENNRTKHDDFPSYKTSITSEGNKNVSKQKSYTINYNLLAQLKVKYNLK